MNTLNNEPMYGHGEHAAIQMQDHVFKHMVDHASDTVVVTSGGVIMWVSASIERWTGWKREELIGTHSWQWVSPEDHHILKAHRENRNASQPTRGRFRLRCQHGGTRWLEIVSTAIPDAIGGPDVLNVLRDVHDQVLAEQERDRLGDRLGAMVEAMFEAHAYLMPVTDADDVMVDLMVMAANPAACRSLRRPRHDIEGQLVSVLLPRLVYEGLRVSSHIMATGEAYVVDDVRMWNDLLGQQHWYDLRMMRIGEGLALTYRDVTERHARFDAEARLRAVEVLGTERERLARDLHDGAIQKVFATSLRLAALAAQLPEDTRHHVEELIDLQDAVIRDLRATVYQLGTTGRSVASPLRPIHDAVGEAAHALGFQPEVMIDDRISRFDDVTLGHLLLVLGEALSNVARHAAAHHVEVSLVPAGSDVILSVWDDGVGLPLDGPRGDGLRNMDRRAALLGGCSRVISEPGGGTEVIWRVPQSVG